MIIVRLAGGLGNQIFQLAAAIYLRKSESEKVILDVSSLSKYQSERNFALQDIFDFPSYISVKNRGVIDSLYIWIACRLRLGKLLPLVGVSDRNIGSILSSKRFMSPLVLLDGYFQNSWDAHSFEVVRAKLLVMLSKQIRRSVKNNNTYSIIHIRGGDFLKLSSYLPCDVLFYDKAVNVAIRSSKTNKFLIVTDDHVFALSIIKELSNRHSSCSFVLNDNDGSYIDDFVLIMNASVKIIPNSTFSWWASALSVNQVSSVYSPTFWHKGLQRSITLSCEHLVD